MASSSFLSKCLVFTLCGGAAAWVAVHEDVGILPRVAKNEVSGTVVLAPPAPAVAERQEGPSEGAAGNIGGAFVQGVPQKDATSKQADSADAEGLVGLAGGLGSKPEEGQGAMDSGSHGVASGFADASAMPENVGQSALSHDAGDVLPEGGKGVGGAPDAPKAASARPDDAKAGEGTSSSRIPEARSSQMVAAPLSHRPPVQADADGARPELELVAEKMLGVRGSVLEGGDEVAGTVRTDAPMPQEKRQDSVVTGAFVRDLARWMADSYVPPRRAGSSGSTSATLAKANERFSSSRTLRSLEKDPLKARASVLRYVFQPNMLEVLYRMYGPELVEELEAAVRRKGQGAEQADARVADVFSVYAEKFRRTATSLQAASRVDIKSLGGAVRRAAQGEAAANKDFARAYTAHAIAREEGNTYEAKMQSSIMVESARVASMYVQKQETARRTLTAALQKAAGKRSLDAGETLFLGEWLARHGVSSASAKAASDIFRRMAEQFEARAEAVLVPAVEPAVQPVQTAASLQPVSKEAEVRPSHLSADSVPGTIDEVGQEESASRVQEAADQSAAEGGMMPQAESSADDSPAVPATTAEVTGSLSSERPPAPLGTVSELLKAMEMKAVSGPIPAADSASR